MQSASSREQILAAIASLSEQQLSMVLKFIQTLPPIANATPAQTSIDPLAGYIGANNPGNLAHAIDETLYD